ncbi:MAG TPA: hypothetical protein PKJ84_08745 [Anaerolineales bacterium]|nr:hypothetical protein [Anaerolineales bacterium]
MKNILGVRFKLFLLFFAVGTGFTFAIGWLTQFHVTLSDYWNVLYYGRHMTLSQPESLYNGFYPFGYAFLIGQMPLTYVLPLSYLLNALLSGLLVASVSTLVAYTDSIPATAIAFYSSIAAPFVFQNANTLGPDIGAAAFIAFAVFLLCHKWLSREDKPLSDTQLILAGVSLGLSFLWRTHAAVAIIAILTGYILIAGIRPFRPLILLAASLAGVAGIQIIVNLVSGHGPLETAQAFNLYKYFYGVNWTNPVGPEVVKDFSLIRTITNDPTVAFNLYKPFFLYFISHTWAALLAFILLPKGRFSRFSLFSFVFIVLYAIPISLSDSPRAPAVLMSVYLPSLAVLLAVLIEAIKKYFPSIRLGEWIGIGVFIAVAFPTFYSWAVYDVGIAQAAIAERKVLSVIEQTLRTKGLTSSDEIFSDRYDFYTPNTMPYHARGIEKWSVDWFWGMSETYPLLPNDTWESFATACKEEGIRFLVLGPNSYLRGDFFGQIYTDDVNLDALGLQFIGQRGNKRLYEFK